jgi:hypothetical protein
MIKEIPDLLLGLCRRCLELGKAVQIMIEMCLSQILNLSKALATLRLAMITRRCPE